MFDQTTGLWWVGWSRPNWRGHFWRVKGCVYVGSLSGWDKANRQSFFLNHTGVLPR